MPLGTGETPADWAGAAHHRDVQPMLNVGIGGGFGRRDASLGFGELAGGLVTAGARDAIGGHDIEPAAFLHGDAAGVVTHLGARIGDSGLAGAPKELPEVRRLGLLVGVPRKEPSGVVAAGGPAELAAPLGERHGGRRRGLPLGQQLAGLRVPFLAAPLESLDVAFLEGAAERQRNEPVNDDGGLPSVSAFRAAFGRSMRASPSDGGTWYDPRGPAARRSGWNPGW